MPTLKQTLTTLTFLSILISLLHHRSPNIPVTLPEPGRTPVPIEAHDITPPRTDYLKSPTNISNQSVQDQSYSIFTHPASQEYPRIDSNRVVWQDSRYGPTEIFIKDLNGGEVRNLTNTDTWEIEPDIDGNVVVWRDAYNGFGIHGIDINTGNKFTVTEGKPDTTNPRISGDIVIWSDNRSGNWNIYGYNLRTNNEFLIASYPDSSKYAEIDGDYVVWSAGQIFVYRISTGETSVLSSYGFRPVVYAGKVAWIGYDMITPYLILYDIQSKTTTQLIEIDGGSERLVFDSGKLLWQNQAYGSWDIYMYILADETHFPISRSSAMQYLPDLSGNTVVWQDNRDHQWDIYGFTWQGIPPPLVEYPVANPRKLNVGAFPEGRMRITWDYSPSLWPPDFSNSRVFTRPPIPSPGDVLTVTTQLINSAGLAEQVYLTATLPVQAAYIPGSARSSQGTVTENNQLVFNLGPVDYNLESSTPVTVTYAISLPNSLPSPDVLNGDLLLAWNGNQSQFTNRIILGSHNYFLPLVNGTIAHGFVIERSRGIIGTSWQEVKRISISQQVYTDTLDVMDESYWYRAKVFSPAGYSAYSNESFNSTFNQVPNLDEQYLHVLVNEARADPAAAGYPEYDPLPPLAYNALLAYATHSHSQSILNSNFQFGHYDPAGRYHWDRAWAVGYDGSWAGDNLIQGQDGPDDTEGSSDAFLASPGHRYWVLNPDVKEFGAGHTYDPEKGDYWHGQYTEGFGITSRELIVPALPAGSVVPYIGNPGTDFTYIVNFYSADGYTPYIASVIIDGIAHSMGLSTGIGSNGTYRYSTTLEPGSNHEYYFYFEYGPGLTARWPEEGSQNYPDVEP